MRKLRETAAIALMLGAAPAYADDDKKTLPGAVCKPTRLSQADDFAYRNGAIRNRSNSRNRRVECPLLRDRVTTNASCPPLGLDEVRIYVDQPSANPFACRLAVLDASDGTVVDSADLSTDTTPGGKTLSASQLTYGLLEEAVVSLRCRIPPRGRIRGIYIAEDLETDDNEGE